MRLPVFLSAQGILKQPSKRHIALRTVEGFVTRVTVVLEPPTGRGVKLLDKASLRTRKTARALERRGSLAGAVSSRNQLRDNGMEIVSVSVDAIPDDEDKAEAEGGNEAKEIQEDAPSGTPVRTTR